MSFYENGVASIECLSKNKVDQKCTYLYSRLLNKNTSGTSFNIHTAPNVQIHFYRSSFGAVFFSSCVQFQATSGLSRWYVPCAYVPTGRILFSESNTRNRARNSPLVLIGRIFELSDSFTRNRTRNSHLSPTTVFFNSANRNSETGRETRSWFRIAGFFKFSECDTRNS